MLHAVCLSEWLSRVRTLLGFSLAAAAVLGAVILIAPRLAEPAAASAVIAAASICLAVGVVAMVPPALVTPRYPDYLMQAAMGAMIIRLFVTLAVGALYLRMYDPPRAAFMNAMVVCYLALLASETVITLRMVKEHWRPPQAESRKT